MRQVCSGIAVAHLSDPPIVHHDIKPPQAMDDQDSPAADVWALGTIFYMLLTDLLPYPGLDGRDVDDASRFIRPLRPASNYNINVDPLLDAILTRCLAVSRQDLSRFHRFNRAAIVHRGRPWNL